MQKLLSMENEPHLLILKENEDNLILGFIGKEDLISNLKYCQLNLENC